MKINIIVAMAFNRLIGNNNQLPWYLPADLKHFKTITWGNPIIMGRKTFQSIGKALPGRTNIIITHDPTFAAEDCVIAHSLEEACQWPTGHDEVFIIGGSTIYQQALPLANMLYITLVNGNFTGDCYFPEWFDQEWVLTKQEAHTANQTNKFGYTFLIYKKR